MRQDFVALAKTTFGLVALYLVLFYSGGLTNIINAGGEFYLRLIKTLQARA